MEVARNGLTIDVSGQGVEDPDDGEFQVTHGDGPIVKVDVLDGGWYANAVDIEAYNEQQAADQERQEQLDHDDKSERRRYQCTRPTRRYFRKWKGVRGAGPPQLPPLLHFVTAAVGSFLLIGTLSTIRFANDYLERSDYTTILGSFGASAVVLFAVPESPLSQPANIFFGQLQSAIIGLICRMYIAENMGTIAFALPLAVTSSLMLMMVTRTVHPPAGGTVAIAVLSSPGIDRLGWGFLIPVLYGSILCVILSVIVNNFRPKTRYPLYWITGKRDGCV